MARVDKSMAVYGDWQTEAVLIAQRLLNEAILNGVISNAILTMDGKFGDKTLLAVKAFQKAKKLSVDGVVGPDTFGALGLKKVIQHPVRLRGQPTKSTCWKGAMAMLHAGLAPPLVTARLEADGTLTATDTNVKAYADDCNCVFLPAPLSPELIGRLLQPQPVWVGGAVKGHSSGVQMHAVVIGGLYAYEFSGTEVALKIYDPWPVGRGTIYFSKGSKVELEDAGVFTPGWFLAPRKFKP